MLPDPLPRRRASSIALNYCSDVMPLGLTRSDAAVGKLNVLYAVSRWVSPLGGDVRCWSKICESLEKDDAPWPLSSSSTKFSISKGVWHLWFSGIGQQKDCLVNFLLIKSANGWYLTPRNPNVAPYLCRLLCPEWIRVYVQCTISFLFNRAIR